MGESKRILLVNDDGIDGAGSNQMRSCGNMTCHDTSDRMRDVFGSSLVLDGPTLAAIDGYI